MSSTEPRLEDFVFFLDQSLGGKVIRDALCEQGLKVALLKEHFPTNTPDEEWLPVVGEWGWLIFTKDDRIRYRQIEKDALMRSCARAFFFSSGNMSGDEMAAAIINALPKIEKFLAKHPPPFIARISRGGEVRLLFPA